MQLRYLVPGETTGDAHDLPIPIIPKLQFKPDNGVWQDVPEVNASTVRRAEADEQLAQEMAARGGVTPAKALEIIQAARATT